MASAPAHTAKASELRRILDRWERRYAWRQLSITLPRALGAALFLGLLAGVYGYFRLGLGDGQRLVLAGALCAAGLLLSLLVRLLRPRGLMRRARYFDLEFGLQERVSAALELMQGRIVTHPELETRQIADALQHARAIDASAKMPLEFRRREWTLLAVLCLALLGSLILPARGAPAALPVDNTPALEAPQADIRDMMEAIAKEPALDDGERQNLLQALQIGLERLQEEALSAEEAFAIMNRLQSQLEQSEQRLQNTAALEQDALVAALEALGKAAPPDAGPAVEDSAARATPPELSDLAQALQNLAQDAMQSSPEAAQQAASTLETAAERMAQAKESLAQQMQSMADALQAQDERALQERLQSAQQSLAQEQVRQQQRARAQQMLRDQAARARAASESIAQQQAQAGASERNAEQSQPGQGRSAQPSNLQPDRARSGANSGNQQPQRNLASAGENPAGNDDSRSAGAGAGDGAADNRSLPGGGGEDQGASTDNQAGGGREIEYEALYSPRGVRGGGTEEIRLESEDSERIMEEGDFDDNPLGESRVSYDTVFREYAGEANRALENDRVPLGLRDIVRDYFTSLEPGGDS